MKAFIFGKFLPFHNGHLAMIRFALEHCETLYVIVCSSDQELISGATRQEWIRASTDEARVKCIVYHYNEQDLPNTSVPSEEASALWARAFKKLVPDCALLVSSEDYGPMVAIQMGIQHLYYDKARQAVNISATRIRDDLFTNWHQLPNAVKEHFAAKVCITGTESTGKTTLVKMLADTFSCTTVQEAGRNIVPQSGDITLPLLRQTAIQHAHDIREATRGVCPLIIADTDLCVTQSYARHFLKLALDVPQWTEEVNRFDLYLYLNKDVPFIQDGTRLFEGERNLLDNSHRLQYEQQHISLMELKGSYIERRAKATAAVKQLITTKSRIEWRKSPEPH